MTEIATELESVVPFHPGDRIGVTGGAGETSLRGGVKEPVATNHVQGADAECSVWSGEVPALSKRIGSGDRIEELAAVADEARRQLVPSKFEVVDQRVCQGRGQTGKDSMRVCRRADGINPRRHFGMKRIRVNRVVVGVAQCHLVFVGELVIDFRRPRVGIQGCRGWENSSFR